MAEQKNIACLSMNHSTCQVPVKLFALNRERLSSSLKNNPRTPANSVVILEGGDSLSLYDTDVDYVFRQEAYFMWCFGVMEPGCFGTINVNNNKSTLFVPRLPQEYEVWMGPLLSLEDIKKKYEVDEVYYVDQIKDVLKKNDVLLTMKGINTDSNLEAKEAHFTGIEEFKRNTEVLFPTIAELRVIKTDLELDVIRYVVEVSSQAHRLVMRAAKPGVSEYHCEAVFLDHAYRVGGCRHVSYTCICGSGTNSAILHYGHAGAPNNRVIRDGDMCLFDMGANYFGYAADITCSFPANGKFTADQKMIYEAVLLANQNVIKNGKPGDSWVDMHLLAAKTLLEELKKGGLLKGDVNEMIAAGLFAIFQPHGLGHLMGLDVHDVGGYLPGHPQRPSQDGLNKLRTARVMQPGMVLTVEPGCYFIKPLLEKAKKDPKLSCFLVNEVIERFTNFGGVRIEDDVIVTKDGIENITNVPRTVEEIEKWMNSKN